MTIFISAEHAREIIENSSFPILLMDQHGKASYYNRTFAQLVGAKHANELIGCQAGELENHRLSSLLSKDTRISWVDHKGTTHDLEIHRSAISTPDGGEALFYIDASKRMELEQELQQQTLTDTSTGLLNQRGIMLALEPQVARSRRYNNALSVIMVDTQTQGQREKLLVAITRFFKVQLRWADLIGCNKHQNFILVLPETAQKSALLLAEKLKKRMHSLVELELENQTLSVHCGVTSWCKNDNAKSLLKRCELALSQARSASKECAEAL